MIRPIVIVERQQIVCDNCKKLFQTEKGIDTWDYDDALPTKEDLENKGWEAIDGKHYCPNCKLC